MFPLALRLLVSPERFQETENVDLSQLSLWAATLHAMSSAAADAIELGRRRTLAQLRRCFYGQHRVGVIAALGLREATQYGAELQKEAWHDAPVLHGDRLGAQVRGRHASPAVGLQSPYRS
jgi:hypothetical protein